MANLRLPVLQNDHGPGAGSLGRDGKRIRPYPADVRGPWQRARRVVYYSLIAVWAALPWIPIHGHPAVYFDVTQRRFFLFGGSFNAQDLWLLFLLVSGFGFGLLYVTSIFGRVWCGWSCPQTVFIEGIFRPIERLVNGPRNEALRRPRGIRTVATHVLYLLASVVMALGFIAYFTSARSALAQAEGLTWLGALTALFYGVFGLFREQFCVVMCPYGRLQSVLIDDDALVVGYDERRGEPREKGKTKRDGAGDCVDCNRCVVVCPTGIDIREGLQLDCIACTACIDACDEVMAKLARPRGLIRYDSLRGLRGEPRRILRPRLYGYTALLLVGVLVAGVSFRRREPFEANLLRLPGTPYTHDGGILRNAYEIHLVNKSSEPATFRLSANADAGIALVMPYSMVEIEGLGSRRIPVFATESADRFASGQTVVVHVAGPSRERDVKATFVGARVTH